MQCFSLIACIYKRCRWRSNYEKGEGWDVIDRLISVTFCVPVLNQELDFQRHLSCFFLYSMIGGERCLIIFVETVELSTITA